MTAKKHLIQLESSLPLLIDAVSAASAGMNKDIARMNESPDRNFHGRMEAWRDIMTALNLCLDNASKIRTLITDAKCTDD